MKHVLFSLNRHTPAEVFSACEEACLRFGKEGISGAVCTGDETERFLEEGSDAEEVLIVCDDPVYLKTLQEQGHAVIALQHGGNAAEKFRGAKYLFSEPQDVDLDADHVWSVR